ncbi:MAG: glycosyltransferase family 1 protein [bacterium]|nr:glycosyltransferase family 1 protein [bacterium]
MRIGLDLRMLGGGSGISRYVMEISTNILEKNKDNEYVLFFNKLDQELRSIYEKFNQKMVETGINHYSLAEQLELPLVLHRENLDLVHFPHFNVPFFYRKPYVVTIHDLIHTKYPGRKKSHLFHRLAYNLIINNAIKTSRKIIAVSESTKKEIIEYFKVDDSKIQVVYEGAGEKYKVVDKDIAQTHVKDKFGLAKPYILYVGVWRRYKNLLRLAKAFDKLRQQGMDIELVLAGAEDPYYPEIRKQISDIRYHESVKVLGRVSDEDLNFLYNGASLFVLPSLSEGFGLTALEAGVCGVAVVCSDISTLREVMGQGAEYFDPHNLDNMVDVIQRILEDPKRQEELANLALSRSKHFSWQKAAEETIRIYESL